MSRINMIDVAFGVPERSASDAVLLDALLDIAVNFDESPAEMHAVLGPPGSAVRWFTFAMTTFRRGRRPAERFFWQFMESHISEVLMVATSGYGRGAARFEAGGTKMRSFILDEWDGKEIAVYRNQLPSDARRDGTVAEIGLGALGLPLDRPLETLLDATHEVRLRVGGKVQRKLAIRPLTGPVLPCRVMPDSSSPAGQPKEKFRAVDRLADTSQVAEIAAAVELAAEDYFGAPKRLGLAYGDTMVPGLVAMLQNPETRPFIADLCLETLAYLGAAPETLFSWVHRGRSARELAFASLARLGESARLVLVANTSSANDEARVAAEGLLAVLDDPAYAPLRAVRVARDEIAKILGPKIDRILTAGGAADSEKPLKAIFSKAGPLAAGAVAYAIRSAMDEDGGGRVSDMTIIHWAESVKNAGWAVASYIVECPQLETMGAINGARCLGASFLPIAAQLLTLEPHSDDPVLKALVKGRPSPSMDDIAKLRRARTDSDPRHAPPKAAAKKKPAKKKPVKRKPAKKNPAKKR